jgi:hypothetical protein
MGILIIGLTGQQVNIITGREMLDIIYKKLFNISTGPGIVEMPGLPKLWKSQGDSHNFLENSESFPQSFGKAKKQLFHIRHYHNAFFYFPHLYFYLPKDLCFCLPRHVQNYLPKMLYFYLTFTSCYCKVNGKWLIVHEQVFVPVDLRSGKAMMDLKP